MNSARKQSFVRIASIVLVPAIFLLHNFSYYKSLLFYKDIHSLLLIYLTVPVLLYFLFKRLFKFSCTVSTLVTISLSVFFCFFGAIQDFLLKYSATYYLGKTYTLLFILITPLVYIAIKKPEATRFLKFLSATIIFFFLAEVGLFLFNIKNFNEIPKLKERVILNTEKTNTDSLNIYHIIFDGYTNSAILQKEFSFNNPVDSFLKKLGFFIAPRSKSNYNFTPYSLSSILNLQYLNVSGKGLERTYKNYFLGNKLYHNNTVFNFFKNRGYDVGSFSILDDYDHLDKLGTFVPKTPAFSIRNQTLERVFLNPWLWQKLTRAKPGALPKEIKNSLQYYIDYNEKALAHILRRSSARNGVYNFTHFLLPHEPYVYIGTSIDSLEEHNILDHQQGYVKQVIHVNSLIEKIVVELQKNKNNIILIQGDHGFREYDHSKRDPHQQLETFNAIYFPDQNYSSLYNTTSLVNTYRIVLNQYFHQNLPLLRDQYFIP